MNFNQVKELITESHDAITSHSKPLNNASNLSDVECRTVINLRRQALPDGFEFLKEIDGPTLDQILMVASGMTQSQFRASMVEKGQQRYFMPTQNLDRCSQHCSHCFMTERDCSDKGHPISNTELTYLIQKFVDRGTKPISTIKSRLCAPTILKGCLSFPKLRPR